MSKNYITNGLLASAALIAFALIAAGVRASCTAPECVMTTTYVSGAPGTSCIEYSLTTAFDDLYDTSGGGTLTATGNTISIRSNTCNAPTNCNPVEYPTISTTNGLPGDWSPKNYNQQYCNTGST